MTSRSPSIWRVAVAAGFALSCFALALFLWIAFGGPTPLSATAYRIKAHFPEATTLAQESDVRIAGVNVGKVRELSLGAPVEQVDGKDATEAVLEIDPEFAPISSDARAMLRQKTLLGETYVELTPGSRREGEAAPVSLGAAAGASDAGTRAVEPVPEGGVLPRSGVEEATQIDEIFNALDAETRRSFQRWQANAAVAIRERGLDLNDTLGNFGPFVTDASDMLETLERQRESLRGLVRDTGTVFEAATRFDSALAGAITGSEQTLAALASEDAALAETFRILPTFQRESRATFRRLDGFQAEARPLVRMLLPVARDISPTLRSVRRLSPSLESLFVDLEVLLDAAERGLPAARGFLDELAPTIDALEPFLANLNPVIRFLSLYRTTVSDFIATPGAATAGSLPAVQGQSASRHYLRQLGYIGSESLSVHPQRLATNRGNNYTAPLALNGFTTASEGIFPNFDCKNVDYGSGAPTDEDEVRHGETPPSRSEPLPDPGFAPCVIQGGGFDAVGERFERFGGERFPRVFADP